MSNIHLHDFMAVAAKAPSKKAVKKAAEVLKQKQAAKAANIADKAQSSIDRLVKLATDNAASERVDDAKIAKLQAQVQRIEQGKVKRTRKQEHKIQTLVERIQKVRDKLKEKDHGDLKLPKIILPYFEDAVEETSEEDTKPAKKALGKGLNDLKGDGGKTKKSIKQMTSESSGASSYKYDVEETAQEVRNLITEAFDEFMLGRKVWNPKVAEAQPNTVRWERKNAYSPANKFGPARKHFQQITCLSTKSSDKNEMLELLESVIEEAGSVGNLTYLSGHMVIELDSNDGSNMLIFEDGTAGWTVSHNFHKG